jgi:hypothetical protein
LARFAHLPCFANLPCFAHLPCSARHQPLLPSPPVRTFAAGNTPRESFKSARKKERKEGAGGTSTARHLSATSKSNGSSIASNGSSIASSGDRPSVKKQKGALEAAAKGGSNCRPDKVATKSKSKREERLEKAKQKRTQGGPKIILKVRVSGCGSSAVAQ